MNRASPIVSKLLVH